MTTRRYRIFMHGDRQVEMRNHRWYFVNGDGLGEAYECEDERSIEAVWVVPALAKDALREAAEALEGVKGATLRDETRIVGTRGLIGATLKSLP